MAKSKKYHTVYRNARTGLLMTESKAKRMNPANVIKEKMPNPGFGVTKK